MKHFSIEELCRSDTAQMKGIDNSPDNSQRNNITALIENVLDPLREMFGKPIYVNSGFRCEKLNKAVGGVITSQHLKGMAADITCNSRTGNRELAKLIAENLDYDQLIDEQKYSWVHVSFNPISRNRREILRIVGRSKTNINKSEL